MGKRNKKAKAPVTEAKIAVSKKPTTVDGKAAKKENNTKQKRTKDSERLPRCQSYYYALFIAIISVSIFLAMPHISMFISTSERPSYRVLTTYAKVDPGIDVRHHTEGTSDYEKRDAPSTEDYDRATQEEDEYSGVISFEDTNSDGEVQIDSNELLPGHEAIFLSVDVSESFDHDDNDSDKGEESRPPKIVEEEATDNERHFLHEADDGDSVEKKQPDIYITDTGEENLDVSPNSDEVMQKEAIAHDETTEDEHEMVLVRDTVSGSDSEDNEIESPENEDVSLIPDIPEDSFEYQQHESITEPDNGENAFDVENEKVAQSQPVDETSESTSTDISSGTTEDEEEKYDDFGDKETSSDEVKDEEDSNEIGLHDTPRIDSEIPTDQIDELGTSDEDSLAQINKYAGEIVENDVTIAEIVPKTVFTDHADMDIETSSDSRDDELLEQTKDSTHVDDIDLDAVPTIADDTDEESVSDLAENVRKDDDTTHDSEEKEFTEESETSPQASLPEQTVISSTESDLKEMVADHQQTKTGGEAVEVENEDTYSNDEEEVDIDDEEDEDEDEAEDDISAPTEDDTSIDNNENVKEVLSQSLETDTSDSDESYMDISKGVRKRILKAGRGEKIDAGDIITIHCIGYLDEDPPKKFWSTKDPSQRPFTFSVGKRQVIKGWDEGALSMMLYERSRIKIEPKKAYGKFGFEAWGIPPGAKIILEMEVIEHKKMKSR